jgi:hypothetical protein
MTPEEHVRHREGNACECQERKEIRCGALSRVYGREKNRSWS